MGWRENRPHLPEKRCQFAGTCVGVHVFGTIDAMTEVVEAGVEITRPTFLRNCQVRYDGGDLMEFTWLQLEFPADYTYWKSSFNGSMVYYFKSSAIEFFWKERV